MKVSKSNMTYQRRLLLAVAMTSVWTPALLWPMIVDLQIIIVTILIGAVIVAFVLNLRMMTYHVVHIDQEGNSAIVKYYKFNSLYEASVTDCKRQITILRRFSKYPTYVLRVRTDAGVVVRQYEVCGWTTQEFEAVVSTKLTPKGRSKRTVLFAIVIVCTMLVAMYRWSAETRRSVCDLAWKRIQDPMAGTVHISGTGGSGSPYIICTVVDLITGDTIEVESEQFRVLAQEGDSVRKGANDICAELIKSDTAILFPIVNPSSMCIDQWKRLDPALAASIDARLQQCAMMPP